MFWCTWSASSAGTSASVYSPLPSSLYSSAFSRTRSTRPAKASRDRGRPSLDVTELAQPLGERGVRRPLLERLDDPRALTEGEREGPRELRRPCRLARRDIGQARISPDVVDRLRQQAADVDRVSRREVQVGKIRIREGLLDANPAADVPAPRGPKRLPKTLDADQMGRLLELPQTDPLAVRDWAMMELLYSSGLRLAELVGLDIGAVDLADGTVRVTGKGNKTRVVPVGSHARTAIAKWLKQRGHLTRPNTDQALFLGARGNRISARSVQSRVQLWARRQGLAQSVSPHLFRHSFASHLLESSGDLRGVQELLGHANISTTQVYTHLDFQHLAQIYDQTHPRARRKKSE